MVHGRAGQFGHCFWRKRIFTLRKFCSIVDLIVSNNHIMEMKLVTYDWGLIESLVAGELLTNRLVESSLLQQHGNHHHPGQLCEWRPSGESHWAHLMYVHHQEGLGRGPSLPDIPCLNCLHLFTALFFNHGTIIYLRLVCCVKTLDNLGYYDVWFRWLCLYPYHIRRDQEPQISAGCNDSCGELESETFRRIEQNKISNFKSHLPEGKWEPLFKADAFTVLRGGLRTKAEIYGMNNMLGRLNCKRERVKVVLFFYPQWFVNHLPFLTRSF